MGNRWLRVALLLAGAALLLASCGGGATYTISRPFPSVGDADPICYNERCTALHPVALAALEPSCTVMGPTGETVRSVDCEASVYLSAGQHLQVSTRCGVEALIEPRPGELRVPPVVAIPVRRYLRDGAEVAVQNDQHWLHREHASPTALPANTLVEVLHGWPDESGACGLALVRIVDAGGAPFDARERTAPPGATTAEGRIGWVRLDQLSDTPIGAPSARERVAAEERAQREQAERVARATAERELRDGRCADERRAALEAVLTRDVALARGLSGPDGVWDLVDHEYIVASDAASDLTFRPSLGGEYHVIAIGTLPITLDVFDRDGARVQQPSPYEAVFASGGVGASRLVAGRPLEEFRVRVRGSGCTLVVALARY